MMPQIPCTKYLKLDLSFYADISVPLIFSVFFLHYVNNSNQLNDQHIGSLNASYCVYKYPCQTLFCV